MKFEIKSRKTGNASKKTGSVLFSMETETLKLCVEAAVKARADLRCADLRGAYLRGAKLWGASFWGADFEGADLWGAELEGADLWGANFDGVKINDGITVTKPPIHIIGIKWLVTIWDAHMQIGGEFHTHDEWRDFSDEEWLRLGDKAALKMKREQFTGIISLCDQHRPKEAA